MSTSYDMLVIVNYKAVYNNIIIIISIWTGNLTDIVVRGVCKQRRTVAGRLHLLAI